MQKQPSGAEILVQRRCWTKLRAGLYDRSALGKKLDSRIESGIRQDLDRYFPESSVRSAETTFVDRAAIRPSPQQLLRFSILVFASKFEADPRPVAIDVLTGISQKLFAWGVKTTLVGTKSGFSLAAHGAHAHRTLPHSIVSAKCSLVEDIRSSLEVSVGLDAVAIAVAASQPVWPPSVRPCDLEVWSSNQKRADVKDLVEYLEMRSISCEVVPAGGPWPEGPFAPARLVISDGKNPFLLLNGQSRLRLGDLAEVARLCRS